MKPILCATSLFFALAILAIAISAGPMPAAARVPLANAVRISQVYGGGGNNGAAYRNDFIELFNSSATTATLTGWSVQYASTTGSTWQVTNLSGAIGPGRYYLVQQAAGSSCSGAPCGVSLPAPDATGSIAMSKSDGKVALVSSTAALSGVCPAGGIVDFVGYGSANCFEGGGAAPALDNPRAALRGDNGCIDTDQNGSDFTGATPVPRNSASAANICPATPPTGCSTIPTIQGSGYASTCLGYAADIRGCITGVAANGFYMQAVGEDVDGDPATSDGIYVYQGSTWTNPAGWAAGNLVRVSGAIIEYYNTTEFQAGNTVVVLDAGLTCGAAGYPAATTIGPNTDPNADPMALYEQYEGMRVQMTFSGWVVGPTKRFTSRFAAGDPEIALVDFHSAIPAYSRVFERDFPGYQGITYLSAALDQDLPDLDFGDEISGTTVTGVLAYQFDKYTLMVDAAPALATVDRPDVTANEPALDPSRSEFDICFANVENVFDHVNDGLGDWGDWAPGYPVSGSPQGLAAYQARLTRVATMLTGQAKSCMVIGLQEVEGKQQVYDDLAAAMHASDTLHTWTAAFVPSGDSRNITQGFLWRDDVALIGGIAAVAGAPWTGWVSDGVLDFVRTPPTGAFRFHASAAVQTDVRLYALHFKSKRASSSCSAADCTDLREREAADLRDILAHHQAAGELAIGGGDLNDTLGSTPIAILDASTAITNPYYSLPANARYSYIFNGESEALDHLYMTRNLSPATPGWAHTFSAIHVNADFPSAEHTSDHDPLRLRFTRCNTTTAPSGVEIVLSAATDITLSWPADANSDRFQVWRDAQPYFTPAPGIDAALGATAGLSFTDAGGVSGAGAFYYAVTAVNACGQESSLSSRVGRFGFALTPGAP
ncbi:MAG: hypothetical protein FJ011_11150 [Chloroflexi bacterium]|nr:hypothetical protein [Chloroflexota bacterium]